MGNWNINIQGVGSHHNVENPYDADRMAADFVESLRAAGHVIEHATFTHGAKADLPGVRAIPSKDKPMSYEVDEM